MADLVISRAGANAICEIASLRKPNLLIPLSAKASRGDQILNARSFENQGFSVVIEEESLTTMTLLQAVDDLYEKRQTYIDAMSKSDQSDAVSVIVKLIEENRSTGSGTNFLLQPSALKERSTGRARTPDFGNYLFPVAVTLMRVGSFCK